MKSRTKNLWAIFVIPISILIGIYLSTTIVSAQVQGYQRNSGLKSLSGSGNNSGDVSGSAGKTSLPTTQPTGDSNTGNTNPGNTPSSVSPITDTPHQVYHPDENYDKWAAQAEITYQKYGGEGAEYQNAMKALNTQYFGQEIALPPASYYSTEYGDQNSTRSNTASRNRPVKDVDTLEAYNLNNSILSEDLKDQFLKLVNNAPKDYSDSVIYYENNIQPFLDKYNLCNDEQLNDWYNNCKNDRSNNNLVKQEPTDSNNIELPPLPYSDQLHELQGRNAELRSEFSVSVHDSDLSQKFNEILQKYYDDSASYNDYTLNNGGPAQGSFDKAQLPIERGLNADLFDLLQEVSDAQQIKTKDQGPIIKIENTPSNNDAVAKQLGLKPLQVDYTGAINVIKIYAPNSLPNLGTGDVLVKGGTAKTVSNEKGITAIQDNYYVVNKYALPEGYVLSGAGEINTNGFQKTGGPYDLPVLDANNIPVYDLTTKADALAQDKAQDSKGVFKYDFNETSIADNSLMKIVNSVLTTVTQNDSIMGHISINQYTKDADVTLVQFGDYAKNLSPSLTQEQKEKSIYDYVNNTIKYADPFASPISLQHTLEQAVASGQGVCRDKASALEYSLDMAGIPSAEVIAPQHVFVAVLNSDGSINHYLDPMYYENYVSLQRTNVDPGQLVVHGYGKK